MTTQERIVAYIMAEYPVDLSFTAAAMSNIEDTGLDQATFDADANTLRTGRLTPEQFLSECLYRQHNDRWQGWVDYVNELCRVVYTEQGRVFEPLSLPIDENTGRLRPEEKHLLTPVKEVPQRLRPDEGRLLEPYLRSRR